MENLRIKPTKNTPQVDFYTNGNMAITGSVYSENAREYFKPLLDWVTDLNTPEINFDMKIEYINTACAKKLFELLQDLDKNAHLQTLNIRWFYPKGDEDALETGQILSESLVRMKFKFVEFDPDAE